MPKVTQVAAAPVTQAQPMLPGPGSNTPPGVPPPRIATSAPEQFVTTGLANNFNGRVQSITLLPRKHAKGKKANTYTLFAELVIKADDNSMGKDGLVVEYYNIANLNQWVPSQVDPVWNGSQWVYTPAGGALELYMKLHTGEAGFPVPNGAPGETSVLPPDSWRGYMAIPGAQNSQDGFPKGTKWEQFTKELGKLRYAEKAPHVNWGDFRQFLVGVYGHWVRLGFEFSGGQAPEPVPGEQQGKIDTLCLAEIIDLGPISGSGGSGMLSGGVGVAPVAPATQHTAQIAQQATLAASPAPASGPAINRSDPAAISAAANEILTALAAQKGPNGITKGDAGAAVFGGVNDRGLEGAQALLLINDNDWLVADERTFGYVPEKGLIVPLPPSA